MARPAFYDSLEYKEKQSAITKRNQDLGRYEFSKRREERTCLRKACGKVFITQLSSEKKYCNQSCAGKINNVGRIMTETSKQKISQALKGRSRAGFTNPFKGVVKIPRDERCCANTVCSKLFFVERWRKVRYCSVLCAMKVVGSRPTSPKASRGKAGIRPDISSTICFFSRWEANIARLYTYRGIKWEFTPKSFDIGGQRYTPDFYLPATDTYIEVKNFWGDYSRIRDAKFRQFHKNIQLKVILKDEYQTLEKQYAHLIPLWEFSTSVFTR